MPRERLRQICHRVPRVPPTPIPTRRAELQTAEYRARSQHRARILDGHDGGLPPLTAAGVSAPIMLLPKGGVNWKSAKARLPPSRAVWAFLTKSRFLLFVGIVGVVVLLWRGLSGTAGEMQRYGTPYEKRRDIPSGDAVVEEGGVLADTLVFTDSTASDRPSPRCR